MAVLVGVLAAGWGRAPTSVGPGAPGELRSSTGMTERERAQGAGVLRGRRVSVHYEPGDSLLADRLLQALDAQPGLPGLPDSVPAGVDAWIVRERARFDSLVGGRTPEWTGGVAIPSRNALVIPAWDGGLTRPGQAGRVLRHEWAHLGLHQYLEGLRIPRWFDEGYAEWAGGWDTGEAWRLRILLATGGAPSLDSLTFRWPGGARAARTAYLLSATVLEYLVAASGERGLEVFLRRWREEGSFEPALRRTYGVTSGQLEEDWRDFVGSRYGWLYVLGHSSVFWALLSVLLVGMVLIRRRERRRRMEELRSEELPDRPAFWRGEDPEEYWRRRALELERDRRSGESPGEAPPEGPWAGEPANGDS